MQLKTQDNNNNDCQVKTDDVKFVRTKHTMRRQPYSSSNVNPSIFVACHVLPIPGSSHHEVSVTEIDSYFPNSMLASSTLRNMCYGPSRTLNTPDRWNDLLEDLERLSISKSSEYDQNDQVVKYTYTVPVIGHFIIRNDNDDPMVTGSKMSNKKNKHPDWVFWDGKFYDPRYMYTLSVSDASSSQRFRKIGWKCPPNQEFDNKSIVEMPYRVVHQSRYHRRNGASFRHVAVTSCTQGSGWLQTEQHPYLEIDLHTEVNITHIGTAGRYPVTYTFPSDYYRKRFVGDSQEAIKEFESKLGSSKPYWALPSIQILESNDHASYVSQYKIQYYHHVSKKWIGLSDVFSGNSDALTEVVHALADHYNTPAGLYTRYLRITPIAYQYKPYMRVAIYGLNTAKKLSNSISQQDDDIEVIRYTVNPGAPGNQCDAKKKECMTFRYKYDYDVNHNSHQMKKEWEAMINDGIYDKHGCIDGDIDMDDVSTAEHVSPRQSVYLSDFMASAGVPIDQHDDMEYEEQLALAQALSLSEEQHRHHADYDDMTMFTANAVISSDYDDHSSTYSYISDGHGNSDDDYVYIESDDNDDCEVDKSNEK